MTKGRILTMIFASIGLVIAFLSLTILFPSNNNFIEGPINLINELPIHLIFGILALYLSSFLIGGKMESLILNKNWNVIGTGIIGSLIILLISVFAGSTVGFIFEGLAYGNHLISKALFDYYLKPIFWVFFFGFIPTMILGSILGLLIKKTAG